jgi:UDPglucose 6-dehydrogenase
MLDAMFNTVSHKRIAILGYAFKKDTNDTRESAAIYVCRDLLEEQAHLAIYDLKVPASEIYETLGVSEDDDRVEVCDNAYSAADGAHAVAILTEWDAFKDLDYTRIYNTMPKPAFLFDGRNILDIPALREIGFEASGIGK